MPESTIQQAFDLALQHHHAGRLSEANLLYQQILIQQPIHAGALHYMGVIAHQQGRHDVAVDLIRKAIALAPPQPEAHNNLGLALKDSGQLNEAIIAYRRALALRPSYPIAFFNLGIAQHCAGKFDEAISAFDGAIALHPQYAEAFNGLGSAHAERGQLAEAIIAFRHALDLRPDYLEAVINLGSALRKSGNFHAAIAAYERAITLNPNFAEIHNTLGSVLVEEGRLDEAVAAYRRAIALKPDFAFAHNNLAYALLGQGNFEQGWDEIEWRLKCSLWPFPRRNLIQPQWDGYPLNSRRILLQTEQGFGDTLQFFRYVSLVAERGGRVVLECQPELHRLFQGAAKECQIVARGQPLPDFDLHCPLLSLPRLFGKTLTNIPNTVPYLFADAHEASVWRTRLINHSPSLKVGLVWSGDPNNPRDALRSMRLADMGPLGQVPGVRLFSLQKGAALMEAQNACGGIELVDHTAYLTDFADTAALIANLDLVVSVDTSVAHLAGAMGKPVWMLLPFVADWRWLAGRHDSPWYPSMRLFRQPACGAWKSVIEDVARALSDHFQNRT